jgi:3-deoxy-manno-octulosonate cytidylyltransferase (CMP-KDO synthetase)
MKRGVEKMKTAIVIPARYASSRFPGKPLANIAGQSMLSRVVDIGRQVAQSREGITLMVATDDQRIAEHCRDIGIECIMTSDQCPTGSDRVLEAVRNKGEAFDTIISLQGDAPFTPVSAITSLLDAFEKDKNLEVVTPVVRLRWSELDKLREEKKETPASGTTAIVDTNGRALYFSKNIIPGIRDETKLREQGEFSPVLVHIGLYAYRADVLERFVSTPQTPYEKLESLEQLRLLESGISVQAVTLSVDAAMAQAGIDSPEDIARAEELLKQMQGHDNSTSSRFNQAMTASKSIAPVIEVDEVHVAVVGGEPVLCPAG